MSTTWSVCAFRKKQKKKALDLGLYFAHQQKCVIQSSSTSLSPAPRIAGIVSSNAHVEEDRNSLKDRTFGECGCLHRQWSNVQGSGREIRDDIRLHDREHEMHECSHASGYPYLIGMLDRERKGFVRAYFEDIFTPSHRLLDILHEMTFEIAKVRAI